MRDGNVLAIDGIAGPGPHRIGSEVSDDLVSMEIEVDPIPGASPFAATEQATVEAARGAQIVNRKGKMERRQAHVRPVVANRGAVQTFVLLANSASDAAGLFAWGE